MRHHIGTDALLETRRFTDAAGPEPLPPHARPAQPEGRLLLAVLEDAVRTWNRCAHSRGRHAARLREQLRAWFLSDTLDWPFSFASACDHLAIDREFVRARLGVRNAAPLAA